MVPSVPSMAHGDAVGVRPVVVKERGDVQERAGGVGVSQISRSPIDEECRPLEHDVAEPSLVGSMARTRLSSSLLWLGMNG